jgi:hypothetical protein
LSSLVVNGLRVESYDAEEPPVVEGSTFCDRLLRLDVRVYEVALTP